MPCIALVLNYVTTQTATLVAIAVNRDTIVHKPPLLHNLILVEIFKILGGSKYIQYANTFWLTL